jgi:thymidylate kinase
MRYALTGSHGVGKTSIINGLEDFLIEKHITAITNSSRARNIKASGLNINDKADDITELLIASNHISHFSNDNWFADRSIIDTYAYAEVSHRRGNISAKTFNTISHLAVNFVGLYDIIFYIPIEFDMVSDGIRKDDESYRKEVDKEIVNFLEYHKKFEILSGSVENRVSKAQSLIDL